MKSRDWLVKRDSQRERTGVANAAIKLDTLYSVTLTHAESVKRSTSAKRTLILSRLQSDGRRFG